MNAKMADGVISALENILLTHDKEKYLVILSQELQKVYFTSLKNPYFDILIKLEINKIVKDYYFGLDKQAKKFIDLIMKIRKTESIKKVSYFSGSV